MSSYKPFDTNVFFSGGAGMFLQYHDIVKPAYLYAIVKMILTEQDFGLPLNIIKNFSVSSLTEWYINRRYINPLRQLDIGNMIEPSDLDDLMQHLLSTDDSIYKFSPALNVNRLFQVYRRQHMSFPVYIYSEKEEPYIRKDCESIFHGIDFKYLFGDLRDSISKCDQNFTYIFSDIELVKYACEILKGTCSHVLLAREYRYNYTDNCKTFKYDLNEMALSHPFIRIGTTLAIDMESMANSFNKITQGRS
jgi:uncharacterized protein YjgD (DUF1641 family)